MRKKLIQKLSTVLLSVAMVFSCLFVLVSCGKKDNDIESLSIELVSDEYVLKNGTISVTYGDKVELDANDFKVVAVYEDDSTTELSLASGEVEGFSFKSTLPSDEKTPAGEYKLTFEYDEVSAEVKVKVNKAVIEVSDVSWNYDEPFTYNKEEQKVELVGLPEGVTATYKNNTAINHGDYVASAELSYVDSDNYVVAPVEDLSWTINKADIDMSTVGTSGPFKYSGTLKSSALYGLPEGVYASLVSGANMATDVRAEGYTVEYAFEYIGDDAENYNPIPNKTFTWMINKNDFTSKFVDIDVFRYTGSEQTIDISNIHTPTGVTIKEISGTTSLTEVGKATLTLTLEFAGKALNNFNIVKTIDVEWEIQKENFDMSGISWDYSGAFTYDGTEKSIAIKGTLPSGLSVKEYSNNTAVNAGTQTASVVFAFDEAHYNNPNFASCTWVINKKTLTIKANDHTIIYLDNASNKGVSYSGFVDGQDETKVSPLSGELVYRYGSYVVGSGVSTYSISISASTLVYQNYTVSYQAGTLTVNPKPIDMKSVAWDYTSPYTYSGFVQKPMLNEVSQYVGVIYKYKVKNTESEIDPIAAMTYVATAEFRTSNNFTLVNNSVGICEFVIQKAVVNVTANNKTINFGENAANAGVSYDGFVNGEYSTNIEISGDIVYNFGAYVAGADVGEYVIDISASNLSADNYSFNYISGKLIVSAIEIDMARVNWNYTAPYTYSGVAQKPILSNLPTGVDVTYTYNYGEDEPKNVGIYTATATFETSKNYTLVNNNLEDLTFEIQKAVVTVTANEHIITFFDEVPAVGSGVTYSGFVNGEDESEKSANVTGAINYTFATYTKGANAGTYENEVLISTSTLEAQNYTFEYVAGDLVVNVKTVDLSGLTWNYDAGTPFGYDGTAKRPTLVGTIPEYVEYEYVYTLNDVEADPINAGEYVATIVFAEPEVASYIVNEPAEVQIEFTIEKAKVDESKIGFNVDDEDGYAFGIYDGEEHEIEFINNTGLELDIHWTNSEPGIFIPREIGIYEFECFVSLNEDDAQNYELEKDHYILTYEVKDFIENYTATINNGIESSKVNYYRTFEGHPYSDFNFSDVILENIEVDFAEGVEGYTYKFYNDSTYMTEVDFSNINHFENEKIYLQIYMGDEIYTRRTLDNIFLKYNVFVDGNESGDAQQQATPPLYVYVNHSAVSIDTTSSSLTFQLPNDSESFATNIYIATTDAQGIYGEFITLGEFGNTTLAISGNDIISAKMKLEYVVGGKSYSYVKYFSIVPNVNTDELFTMTYTSDLTDGYESTASDNAIFIDANVNNVEKLNLSTIEIDMKNENYQEVDGSREIVESNGNFYLKVVLEEKIAQEPENIALYAQANQVVCYIKLYVDGTVDDNVICMIYASKVDHQSHVIEAPESSSIYVETLNRYATIEVLDHLSEVILTGVGNLNFVVEDSNVLDIKITATDGVTFVIYHVHVIESGFDSDPKQMISINFGEGEDETTITAEMGEFGVGGDFTMTEFDSESVSMTLVHYAGDILSEGQTEFFINSIDFSGGMFEYDEESYTYFTVEDMLGMEISFDELLIAEVVVLPINVDNKSTEIIVKQYIQGELAGIITFQIVFMNPLMMGVMMEACDENWFVWNMDIVEIEATRTQLGMEKVDTSATVTLVYTIPQTGYEYSVITSMEDYEAICGGADADDYIKHVETYDEGGKAFVLEIALEFDEFGMACIFICDPTMYAMIDQTIEGDVGMGDSGSHTITLIDCYLPIIITVTDWQVNVAG